MIQTRTQTWSKVAFERVQAISNQSPDAKKKYRTSCKKMPQLIHQAGLLQALVFQVARDAHGQTFIDDLCTALRASKSVDCRGHKDLIMAVQKADLVTYMKLTDDITTICAWFSRFADIELKGGEDAA